MLHTNHSKKQYKNIEEQLHAVQIADCHTVLITQKKVKNTNEWKNADESEQKTILNYVKQNIIKEQENSDFFDKSQN